MYTHICRDNIINITFIYIYIYIYRLYTDYIKIMKSLNYKLYCVRFVSPSVEKGNISTLYKYAYAVKHNEYIIFSV